MTGVKSKQAYADKLAELEERARNGELRDFAFLVADVNGLKYINDTFGHKAGDAYICDASALICRHFKHCPVYRIGGDEFVALMEGDGFASRHADLAAFNRDVESNMKVDRMVVVSAGISEYRPGKDKNVHEAFERADEAMYERKKLLKSQGARTRD
jgi:diguanylate cyclase (GGDEF)-like protein